METRQVLIRTLVLSGFVAIILQLILAPNIAIASVVPNFVLVSVGVMAFYTNPTRAALQGFILGFCYDLFSQGPLGVMALILTVVGYAMSTVKKGSFEGNALIEFIAFAIVVALAEIIHGVVLAIIGYNSDILYTLVFRSLPGALYEILIGLLALVIVSRLMNRVPRKGKKRSKDSMSLPSRRRSRSQGQPLNRKLR